MKKSIKKLFWFYTLLFVLLICYLINFTLIDSEDIVTNSYNPRLTRIDSEIKRGDIKDSNGDVLAYSSLSGESYSRHYNYPLEFSHVIGYTTNGMSGIESKYNFILQNPTNELFQRIRNLITDEDIQGDSITLTLNKDLQQRAYNLLGSSKGSIVIMEPSTGKILAMVSYPNYDPSSILEKWSYLSADEGNNPLLNRATQGLYPPGSTFKILTMASAVENLSDWNTYTYYCKGYEDYSERTINCFDSTPHGEVKMNSALAMSCNTFFSNIGLKLTAPILTQSAEKAMFNKPLDFSLDYNKAVFDLPADSSRSDIVVTSIGQGKTLVTPLYMALLTSSVANNGIMMKPYILDHAEDYNGIEKIKTLPSMLAQPFSSDTAHKVADAMQEVVTSGTGIQAAVWDTKIAGKTGTAENSSGDDHSWFVAFAPVDSPKVAVVVMLENGGTGSKAVPVARELILKALSAKNAE
ncbi:MAG: penicillin-binding protein 2 [Firmicutes bacterium]|nr:penicillin-binding protein 2 [Bacillota bacterium]